PIDATPLRGGSMSCAPAVIVTAAVAFRACHVPAQRPSRRLVKDTAGSPLEKLAATEPLFVRGVPQSSTTVTSSEVGQAAVAEKLCPSWVKIGSSRVGLHPTAEREASGLGTAGVTISSTAMCCVVFVSTK